MERQSERSGDLVLHTFIDAISWQEALDRIHAWASQRESRYVCICNVHSVVTATRDASLECAINAADMATPDGMPVVWTLRANGFRRQRRINGPDLMWTYCARAATSGTPIYLLGSTTTTLSLLQARLTSAFPGLRIVGAYAPPFRPLTPREDADVVQSVNESGAGVVFVGLGCPKQEHWMQQHRGRVRAVAIGVGAAFDYLAGTLTRAPVWMQHSGLEWLFRLSMEPRRLWRRYLVTNSLFIGHSLLDIGRRAARPLAR